MKWGFEHFRRSGLRAMMTALIFPMLIACALCAVTPRSFAGETNTASNSVTRLTTEQLKKIDKLLVGHGRNHSVDSILATKLLVSQTKWRQLTLTDSKTRDHHVFCRLDNGGMFFAFVDATTSYCYHVDANFKLLASSAITGSKSRDITDPEPGLRVELAFWVHACK